VLRFFEPGAPIPDSAFAAAGVSDQGTDRVRLRVPTSADGSVDIGAGIHVDSLLQQTCAALPAADGSLRCLPSIVPDGVDFFADPECTVPAVLFDLLAADCPPPAPTAVSISQTGSSYRVYEVAGPPARALYWRTGLACTDAGTFLDSSAAYALGPEMPPAAFVPMATSDHYPGR